MTERGVLFGIVLTTVAIAGCFGGDAPTQLSVSATGGSASPGWAYDGAGYGPASAALEGVVNDPDNAGGFNATFEYRGSSWRVEFASFGGSEEFKDGGVAFDLVEHGATGVADASIPEILAEVAAWGTARVFRDGEVYADPGSGDPAGWTAHIMLSATTVRQADGRITKADGTTPYDPATPDDAQTLGDDRQALLWFKAVSGEGSARAPINESQTLEFLGPETVSDVLVPAERWTTGRIDVVATPVQGPLAFGQVQVTVLDAEGAELATSGEAVVAPGGEFAFGYDLDAPTRPLTVSARGSGFFTLTVAYTVEFADHPFVVLTWDDYALE